MPPALAGPVVQLAACTESFVYLHLLARGTLRAEMGRGQVQALDAPGILVCRADSAHTLTLGPAQPPALLMCAKAWLDGPAASLLLAQFEQPLVLPLDPADTLLRPIVDLIAQELNEARCGQSVLLQRAGDILFVGVLRHLISQPSSRGGLFRGLADPRIARALVALHAAPQADWSLERLAVEAGMSRTAFATHFRALMNEPPGKYLSRLRLAIARRAVQSGLGLKVAASRAGYGNVSALSRALSRARFA